MPVLPATSSTVYTVGDGDGLYSSTSTADWTMNSVARGFRIYNSVGATCQNYYSTKYITMNARWQDLKKIHQMVQIIQIVILSVLDIIHMSVHLLLSKLFNKVFIMGLSIRIEDGFTSRF